MGLFRIECVSFKNTYFGSFEHGVITAVCTSVCVCAGNLCVTLKKLVSVVKTIFSPDTT